MYTKKCMDSREFRGAAVNVSMQDIINLPLSCHSSGIIKHVPGT